MRLWLAAAAGAAAVGVAFGALAADPGVTATEVKIGNTMPYSGPVSSYSPIGKLDAAFFKMVNEQGGVGGHKIDFITLDDGYSPPKTVEDVRQLVEQDQVAFLFNTLGTPTNSAIVRYVNQKKVPHLFVGGYALPSAISEQPIVCVATTTGRPVGFEIRCARMNDREITEDADDDIMLADIIHRGSATDLGNECAAVDQRAVWIGVEKIAGQVGVEPCGVGLVDRPDIVPVELRQRLMILGMISHSSSPWHRHMSKIVSCGRRSDILFWRRQQR